MTPQQIDQMQMMQKAITGRIFQIKTGDDLGVASWIKGSYNYGKQETVVDQIKKDAADMNMFKQQLKSKENSQIKVANIKHDLAVQRKQIPSVTICLSVIGQIILYRRSKAETIRLFVNT